MNSKGLSIILFWVGLSIFMSSCTWVKLTDEGLNVSVALSGDVKNCLLKGQTTVSLKSKVMGINRNAEQVQSELDTLARNSAVNIGGNTVVSASAVEDGKQTFKVYQCDKN